MNLEVVLGDMGKMNQMNISSADLVRIRQRVLAGIRSIEKGDYKEYEGREGLKRLADDVKARGRKHLAQKPLVNAALSRKQR